MRQQLLGTRKAQRHVRGVEHLHEQDSMMMMLIKDDGDDYADDSSKGREVVAHHDA